MVKAFGVFEGGGAKGLAHVGALKAAEEHEIDFISVAGTSAGAIVASLIAAGYKSDQLFNPQNPYENDVFDKNFVTLLGRFRWFFLKCIKNLVEYYKKYLLFRVSYILFVLVLSATLIYAFHLGLNFVLALSLFYIAGGIILSVIFIYIVKNLIPFGLFSSHKFEEWLNKELRNKLFPGDNIGVVKFEDLPIPLYIIATDIKSRKPVVFSKENYPDYSVAKAVCHSIAIPLAFTPQINENEVLVDGGVLSNFPAWVFDKERRENPEIVSTLGFRLNTIPSNTEDDGKKIYSLRRYILDLTTVFFGDNFLEVREIEDLHLIPIRVSAKTLDFDMDRNERRHLYSDGYVAAKSFFPQFSGPKNNTQIMHLLERFHEGLVQEIKSDVDLLRLNIALPVEPLRRKIRILYPYKMENDADDKLEFKIGSGCIGTCWQKGKVTFADLERAKETYADEWKMDKYQQRLVRDDLKTLISFPIFSKKLLDKTKGTDKNSILAVLSIDSTNDLSVEFSNLISNNNDPLQKLLNGFLEHLGSELER